jgi:hypothetical protein
LASLSDDRDNIKIPLAPSKDLILPTITMTFYCDMGYDEPKQKGRLVPIDFNEDQEDESDNELV